jgi:hypothetical protein
VKTEQDSTTSDTFDQPSPPPAPRNRLLWSVVIFLAFLLYELTAQPAAAIVALCSKAGWEDFRTGLWILRRDPRLVRGWANCFTYCANGMWNTTRLGFLLCGPLLIAMALSAAFGQKVQKDYFLGSLLVAAFGLVLTVFFIFLAIVLSVLAGTRLWLSPSAHVSRREGIWPPDPETSLDQNHAGGVIMTTLAIALVVAVLAGVIIIQLQGNVNGPANGGLGLSIFCGVTISVVGLLLLQLFKKYLERRVIATSPVQCWPDENDG